MAKGKSNSVDNPENLVGELEALYEENKHVFEDAMEEADKPAGRITIAEALESDDPLSHIMDELGDDNAVQKTFRLVYEAILIVNSGGLHKFWDHFDYEEANMLIQHMAAVEAPKMATALSDTQAYIVEALGDPRDEEALFDLVCSEGFEKVAVAYTSRIGELVEEMEKGLLEYSKMHIGEL